MLHSRSVEETRAYLAGKAIGLDVQGRAREARPMDTRVNGLYLAGLWIGYIRYGAPVSVTLSPESSVWLDRRADQAARMASDPAAPGHGDCAHGDYWVHFPLYGAIAATIAGQSIDSDQSCGIIASPSGPHILRASSSTVRLSLEIRGRSLHRQLAALLGDAVDTPLVFAPALRLDQGNGRSLASMLRFAVTEIDRVGLRWSPLLASQFEQFVMCNLLLAQPSNYTKALRLRERPVAPRDVRRAIDYIHENLAEAISLGDLVAVSGVAGRTLMNHFRDFKGVSPMRYIRNLRLERVRGELASGKPTQVIEAAARWGFSHAGRFSIEYRRRFGESPSATLASGRRH
jgi:AraC-like DNA-binding protein